MLSIQRIQYELQDRRLAVVAERTGIHINTIRNIRDAWKPNPTYRVLLTLSDYLEGNPREL